VLQILLVWWQTPLRSLCVRYFFYFDVVFCLCGGGVLVEVVVVV